MLKYYVAAQAFFAKKSAKGQSLAEYGLIIALIAVVCIGILTTLGQNINAMLTDLSEAIGGTG